MHITEKVIISPCPPIHTGSNLFQIPLFDFVSANGHRILLQRMPIALSSCNCFGKCITSQNDGRFLTDNRSKGHISRKAAKKVGTIYGEFRKKQDAEHISGLTGKWHNIRRR